MAPTMPGSGARTKGLHLDPRTSVFVILVVSSVLLSPAGTHGSLGNAARAVLIILPGALFLGSQLPGPAFRYAVTFLALAGFPKLFELLALQRHLVVDVFSAWFSGLSLIIPGITCCWYMLRTTSASEFVSAMQRIHCPNSLSIPTSIIFRFFPTINEEYRDIRTAMKMRGISGFRNPVKMLEYRFVPLLVSVIGIGNELAISAVTRGLGSPHERTAFRTIGFRLGDSIVITALCTCLIMLAVNRVMLP